MVATYRILGFAAAILILRADNAAAGLSPCVSRTILSANGKYLLVLLAPEEERSYRHEYDPTWTADQIRQERESTLKQQQIEATYPQSGLYRNDGSTDLLWPIDYLPTPKDIYVSNDGVHLVVAFLNWDNDTASERGNALEFYANGQQLARYNEDRLLVGYFARLVLWRFCGAAFPTCTNARLDEDSGAFEFETNWGDAFRFDIVTAKLVDSRLPWSCTSFFVLIVVSLVFCGWWFWRRIVQRKQAN